ncbi:hypothetical protein [Xanthobacter sp.]|uniref:hypothetical protein n=1 Tax=Xanthobacter sp. TaxID=35809 RepID=UPI0035B2D03C
MAWDKPYQDARLDLEARAKKLRPGRIRSTRARRVRPFVAQGIERRHGELCARGREPGRKALSTLLSVA